MTWRNTPGHPLSGNLYKYRFDSRGLPNKLRDETNVDVIGSVPYGVAGEVLAFGSESRSYNVNGQMTTLTLPARTIGSRR